MIGRRTYECQIVPFFLLSCPWRISTIAVKRAKFAFVKLIERRHTYLTLNDIGLRKCWRCWRKNLSIFVFLCPPAGKRQLSGRCAKRSCRFPAPSRRRKVYRPWPVKKKASDHVCQPRLRLGRQLHVVWDISYFTGLVS